VDECALYAKLTEIFRQVLDDEEIVLNPQLTADQTSGWDSLQHVRLMLTVEKGFGIKIATSEMIRMKNVGDLARLIGQKISVPAQARI
jgi:acyl carrier protein